MTYSQTLSALEAKRPLIHCISNLVSANDCANLVLAVGGSPIMAQAPEEVAEIAARADALVLNTGTPSPEKFQACILAGLAANRRGIPVVLDPVGIGASTWRRTHLQTLLAQVRPTILRLNAGEARTLLGMDARQRGVDVLPGAAADTALAEAVARRLGCVVLLSGTEDFVTDSRTTLTAGGGSPLMGRVTGAGCMLSALCGAFAAVESDPLSAAIQAARFWKDCAARAEQRSHGLGSFHMGLLDAASRIP